MDVKARLAERVAALKDVIAEQNDRITVVVEDFEKEKKRVQKEIEDRNRELKQQLEDFKIMFDEERRSRIAREEVIKKTLADHEHLVDATFEKERSDREKKYTSLRTEFEENARSRAKSDRQFRVVVREELALLRNRIAAEEKVREEQDETLSNALRKFTQKMQRSLHIINHSEK